MFPCAVIRIQMMSRLHSPSIAGGKMRSVTSYGDRLPVISRFLSIHEIPEIESLMFSKINVLGLLKVGCLYF
jgi:hypothetical protein